MTKEIEKQVARNPLKDVGKTPPVTQEVLSKGPHSLLDSHNLYNMQVNYRVYIQLNYNKLNW